MVELSILLSIYNYTDLFSQMANRFENENNSIKWHIVNFYL